MLRTLNKGSLTQVAMISVAACIFLGLAYGVLTAPICWRCWSHGTHAREFDRRIAEIVAYDSKDVRTLKRWVCEHCKRAWKPGVPWIDDPPNFEEVCASNFYTYPWPWSGRTSLEIYVPNGRLTGTK